MLLWRTHKGTPENRSVVSFLEWRQLLGQGSGQQHLAAVVKLLAFHVLVHGVYCPSI